MLITFICICLLQKVVTASQQILLKLNEIIFLNVHTSTNILSQKHIKVPFIVLNKPLHNLVLMLYSSAFFTAWLIIASILSHLELSMQERLRVSLLSEVPWWPPPRGSMNKPKLLDQEVSQGTHCPSEGLRTAQGELPNSLEYPHSSVLSLVPPSWSCLLQPGFTSRHNQFLKFSSQQFQYQ